MKNRTVVLAAAFVLASLMAFGAIADGTWTVIGAQSDTGLSTLVLTVNGSTLAGTADGVQIASGKVEGNIVRFNLTSNGATLNFKGTISGNQLNLHASHTDGSQHRAYNFNRQ